MKPDLMKILKLLVAFGILGGFGWGIYLVVVAGIRVLAQIQSDIAVALVAASGTVIVSVATLTVQKILETRATITQDLRSKKTPVYEDLIATLFKIQFAEKIGENPVTENELLKFFANITEKLTIWGSDGVIKAFSEFRLASARNKTSIELLFIYEKLLLEIRKDLGHKNTNLSKGTILSLTINDMDQILLKD